MSDGDSDPTVPLTRRTALRSLGALGAGTVGAGAGAEYGGVGLAAAQSTGIDTTTRPAFLETKVSRGEYEDWQGNNIYARNESHLAYYGAQWIADSDPRYEKDDVWRHRFLLSSTGWTYGIDDSGDSFPAVQLNEMYVSAQPGDVSPGNVEVRAPRDDVAIGFVDPRSFSEEVEQHVDPEEVAASLADASVEPGSLDFDAEIEEYDDEIATIVGQGFELNDAADVAAFVAGLSKKTIVGSVVWLTYDLIKSFEGEYQTQSLEDGLEYGGTVDGGFGGMNYVMFEVDQEPGTASSVEISTEYGGAYADSEVTWEIDLPDDPYDPLDAPEPGPCFDERDVWRMGAFPNDDTRGDDTTGYALRTAESNSRHWGTVVEPQIASPEPHGAYGIDEAVEFASDASDPFEEEWGISRADEVTCTPIADNELQGGVDLWHETGEWQVSVHQRNDAGLSGFGERTIYVVADESHEVVPTGRDSPTKVDRVDPPSGDDEYTEVGQ